LKARGQQRTDATHVLAAVRVMNRVVLVGETLHHALNVIAAVDPAWLLAQIDADWFDLYGKRFDDGKVPKENTARLALAEAIGADGWHLLTQVYAPDAPTYLRTLPAVEVLRRV
jgi:transposase